MKAMRFMTNKARTLAFLLGATGAVLTSIPMQANAAEATLLKSNGLTVKACRAGSNMLRFSGFHAGPKRSGDLYGSVHLASSSFGYIRLTQGRWIGDWRGGIVYLNNRQVGSAAGVRSIRISFAKRYENGRRVFYRKFFFTTPSFPITALPRC